MKKKRDYRSAKSRQIAAMKGASLETMAEATGLSRSQVVYRLTRSREKQPDATVLTHKINIRFDPELYGRLAEYAINNRMTVSEAIRCFVEWGLPDEEA